LSGIWIFDLDGTLIDVRPRYEKLYRDLIGGYKGTILPGEKYWRLKKNKMPEIEIAILSGLNEDNAYKYAQERLSLIENEDYLSIDKVFFGVFELLNRLGQDSCYLVTKRRNKDALYDQLIDLKILNLFGAIYTHNNNFEHKKNSFEEIIQIHSRNDTKGKITVVSDSPNDIIDAKCVGVNSIAVLSGLRAEHILQESNPDIMIEGVWQI
jgi:phosphoglycolate phosphatase-like HAD superfamily hydrolase